MSLSPRLRPSRRISRRRKDVRLSLYDGTGGDAVTKTQQYRPLLFIPPPSCCRPRRIIRGATCRVTGGKSHCLRRTKFALIAKAFTIAVPTRRARTRSRLASNMGAPLGPSLHLLSTALAESFRGRRPKHWRGRSLAEEARVSSILQRHFLRRYNRPTRTRWQTHKRSVPSSHHSAPLSYRPRRTLRGRRA